MIRVSPIHFIPILLACTLFACTGRSVPKPYGYFRITAPDTTYQSLKQHVGETIYPYAFEMSANAVLMPQERDGEQYWVNIMYPWCDAAIHCSYKPVRGNLRELTDDAINFVYKHASHASSIPEREFANPEAHVYGVLFELEGNTASPYQFFLTDSAHHFFRGAVYCNCRPNADSLAPVYEYLQTDIIHLMETFAWK